MRPGLLVKLWSLFGAEIVNFCPLKDMEIIKSAYDPLDNRNLHLRLRLAPVCLPLFTSDGLNFYFYALTAHFGQWLTGVVQGALRAGGR